MSIERQTVRDPPATVAYPGCDFNPAEPDEAELVKIVYDPGEVVFAARERAPR